jgi:uncharacterized coiled-coil DUF342 family protein
MSRYFQEPIHDPTPTPVPQPLLVQLIRSISELTERVGELSAKVDAAQSSRRALTLDVKCMSDGIQAFRNEFEPYLKEAIASRSEWRERRSSLVTKVMGAGLMGAVAIILASLWHYVKDMVRSWP